MDDLDVVKSWLPWTAAGDRVGQATTFGGGRRAPGRGRRPWARRGRGGVGAGAAGSTGGAVAACGTGGRGGQHRRAWARAWAAARAARVGGGQHRRAAPAGRRAAPARRRAAPAACERVRGAGRVARRRRERRGVEKQKERKKNGRRWLFRITPVGWRRGRRELVNRRRPKRGPTGVT
jgi:hypothetical protein